MKKQRHIKEKIAFLLIFLFTFFISMSIFIYQGVVGANEDFFTRLIIDTVRHIMGGF